MNICIVGPKGAGKSTLFKMLVERSRNTGKTISTQRYNTDVQGALDYNDRRIFLTDTVSREPYVKEYLIGSCNGCIIVVPADRDLRNKHGYKASLREVCEWFLKQCDELDIDAVLLINKADILEKANNEVVENSMSVMINELHAKYTCLIAASISSLHQLHSFSIIEKTCAQFFVVTTN